MFNSLEDEEIPDNIKFGDCPKFIKRVLSSSAIENSGKMKFLKKFAINYMKDEEMRILTDGCCFLFIDNKDYDGVYPSIDSAREIGSIKYPENGRRFFSPMYPRNIGR